MRGTVANLGIGLPVARLADVQDRNNGDPQGDGDKQGPRGKFDRASHGCFILCITVSGNLTGEDPMNSFQQIGIGDSDDNINRREASLFRAKNVALMGIGNDDVHALVEVNRHSGIDFHPPKSEMLEVTVNLLLRGRLLSIGNDPRLRGNDFDIVLNERDANNPDVIAKQGIVPSEPLEIFERRCGQSLIPGGVPETIRMSGLHRQAPAFVVIDDVLRPLCNSAELLYELSAKDAPPQFCPLDKREPFRASGAVADSNCLHCLRASSDVTCR